MCLITKAIVTERGDGYYSVEYQNPEGEWVARHSSYDYNDIKNSLRTIREKFGKIEVKHEPRQNAV